MSKPFPTDEPFLQGYYAPLHMECDAPNLPITGEWPKALNGSLYRNGPNPQFAPRGPYHWFAGDGMLHAFHVADGRVVYRNRWVRTPKWQLGACRAFPATPSERQPGQLGQSQQTATA